MNSITNFLKSLKREHGNLIEVADFSIITLLSLGAALQLLSQAWLPSNLSFTLPLLYFAYRFTKLFVDTNRLHTGVFTNIRRGRWTARLSQPNDDTVKKLASEGIVMFLLGARINHPLGKLAPGIAEADKAFKNMWDEADKNRDKWSYIGKSSTLWDISDSEGISIFWLSYWKDLRGLQAFAGSTAHLAGQGDYVAKKWPHLGIMHETFHASKGEWETIYINCPPMTLGGTTVNSEEHVNGSEIQATLTALRSKNSMLGRMAGAD